jgi:glycosyltransferase involved in cell wall biosynthesis
VEEEVRRVRGQASSRIKVLHLISTLDVGGAEVNLLRLASSMDRDAFENHVVCMTRPGAIGRSLETAGIPVSSLNMQKGRPDLRSVLRLRFMASLMRPDVIQCWMYHANLLGLAFMKPSRTLWNIRCSDMDLSAYGPLYRFTVKAGARLSGLPKAIVTNSLTGRDVHIRLGYSPRGWVLIPNGFDTEVFKPDAGARLQARAELGIPEGSLVVGIVARLDPMKDLETFFRAVDLQLTKSPSAHVVVAGRGLSPGEPFLNSLIRDEHAPRVHLLGERHDIPRVLSAFDIALSSSQSEGLPNAVGEAMSTGIPCVVTDAGDSAALVGDSGIVVPKGDPEALAAAWERLADAGEDYRKSLGEQARSRITGHYSLQAMVARYQSLYTSLTQDRAR